MYLERFLERPIREACTDTPVVLVTGARQVGKSTLVRHIAGSGATYRTLDDSASRIAAAADPDGFVQAPGTLVIDEIQRVPDLMLAIKAAVDRHRKPGAFILTGSSDVMSLPTVSETLAGRIEIHELRPLSVAELAGNTTSFHDVLREGKPPEASIDRADLMSLLLAGGYPDARLRAAARRQAWFRDYIDTVVQREVPAVADIQLGDHLPRLLRVAAAGSPGALNISTLATATGIPRTTTDRYLALLRQVLLVDMLTPWHANTAMRQVKSLRILLNDTGLLAHLLELDAGRLQDWHPDKIGPLLETLVACELRAQAAWAREGRPRIHWWRTTKGAEVDFVVELHGGSLCGIEVKSSTTVSSNDLRGLRQLRDVMGDRFHRGVVLYTGAQVLPLGDRLEAWPITALWGGEPLPLP